MLKRMGIAPEGYPFIAFFSLLAVAAALVLGLLWAIPLLLLALFMVFFFRDPERNVPDAPGFLSPADGVVVLDKEVDEEEYLHRKARKISIFMSPLNVHVNRAPCEGTVLDVVFTKGGYTPAYREEATSRNQNTAMLMECREGGRILVRQVAGAVARRTVCRLRSGDTIKRGERFGIIKFGSRLDVYLPQDVQVMVELDQRVRAGETVLARPGGGI